MLLKDKRIFIVEDNLENRIVFELLLVEQGAKVAFERWGRKTVERLQTFAPVDLILLDLMFPKGVTGYDIFTEIRKVANFATTPIVAVSATDPSEAIPKARKLGFAGFIAKPIKFAEFIKQIATILEGNPVWDSRS